jgi:beta-barrel assembly-enhancing protease
VNTSDSKKVFAIRQIEMKSQFPPLLPVSSLGQYFCKSRLSYTQTSTHNMAGPAAVTPHSLIAWFTKKRGFSLLLSLTLASGVWATTYIQPARASLLDLIFQGIQVIQLSNLSDQQEVALGEQINQQLLTKELHLRNDPVISSYVNQVGQQLVPFSERPQIPYHFQVIQDPQINAFSTMGGYVYVTTGLLAVADNEAQVASVLGHEMGHISARHAVEQMRQRAIVAGVAHAASLDRDLAVNIGVELAVSRPNSRRDEFEADWLGLSMLHRTGYASSAMPAFLEKLTRYPSSPTFLSTHPAVTDRINTLNHLIQVNHFVGSRGLDNRVYQTTIRSRLPAPTR